MLDLFIMLVFSMYNMYMIVHVVHLNEGPPGKREGEGGGEGKQSKTLSQGVLFLAL